MVGLQPSRGYCRTIAYPWRACFKDESEFPNPESFNPERFVMPSPHKSNEFEPAKFAFGFGRRCALFTSYSMGVVNWRYISYILRVCPGRHLADLSLWINVATILSVFDISMAKDEQGNPIVPDIEFECGFTQWVEYSEPVIRSFSHVHVLLP